MNIKMIVKVIGIVLLLISYWFVYNAGVNKERAADAKLLAKHQKKVKTLINDLEIERAKKKVITHEKIIKIKQAKSKCADTIVDQSILDQLQ